MHQFYGLPGGAAAGASDAKLPDMQAGWEQMCSNVMAGLSGLNMVYEAAGMHASLLGFCHESLILGNDVIGLVNATTRKEAMLAAPAPSAFDPVLDRAIRERFSILLG